MDFVVGHPRSGTMIVSHLLNAARAGVSGHELLYPLSSDMVWVPSEYYAGRVEAEAVRRLLSHYRRRPEGAEVDSNWKLTWILPVLLEEFPDARVLHLARAPADNIASCYALDYYGPLWQHPEAQANHRRNYFLRWMPQIRRPDWGTLDQLEKNCAFYCETHRLAATADRPGRYLFLRIEELARPEVAAGLFAFFDLPAPADLPSLLAQRVNTKDDEKAEVARLRDAPPFAVETVTRLCRETAERLGYIPLASARDILGG